MKRKDKGRRRDRIKREGRWKARAELWGRTREVLQQHQELRDSKKRQERWYARKSTVS